MAPDFDILLESGPLLFVNKPPGLLTQAPPGIDSLEFRVKRFLKVREQKPGKAYLGVPHRLDRPVSGAIVFAKHVRAARRVSEQFEERTVRKVYWALVEGELPQQRGTWTDQLIKLENEPRAAVVDAAHPEGRTAILHFEVVRQLPRATLVQVELETGRMHQIRVQFASRGHTLLGDELYGSAIPFGPAASDPRERLLALHARVLRLQHPMNSDAVEVTAPLTPWWREWDVNDDAIGAPATTVSSN